MSAPQATQGVQGESEAAPLASSLEAPERSEGGDRATACSVEYPAKKSRGNPRLTMRLEPSTLKELSTRAKRLGLDPNVWARAVLQDALDARRTAEMDAALAAAMAGLRERAQASADARELAAQIRPLAINVNDLDRRARLGESVDLGEQGEELVRLLSEVRRLLGDRVAT